jgi:MOSC domain-containing protein YiiM
MSAAVPVVVTAICVGQARRFTDAQGTWHSAIDKSPLAGPVALEPGGLAGDAVADTRHHGSPDQAVCCLPAVHHAHWAARYGRAFGPGAFGENWVLAGADEQQVCVGDVYGVGSARVQVSQPRVPCWKQSRRHGLAELHHQIAATLRTGFYVRVLAPGTLAPGDALELLERPHPGHTIAQLNACVHQGAGDAALLATLAALPELSAPWRARFTQLLERRRAQGAFA